MSDDAFTIGIEEEYLLLDAESLELAEAPEDMISACAAELGDQVEPEFLRCQIEIGTRVCASVAEAVADLRHLRATIAAVAARFGLRPISAGCHPTAEWSAQTHRDRERYNDLKRDLAAVGDRMLICGMHVHVGIPDEDTRIDLMNQASYFLPHLLALSASSPFWQGRDTGLASYRIGVFDNLPRSGLPPRFDSWSGYRRLVEALIAAGPVEDATRIWWDLRPSDRFPTLETRICDACPRIGDVAALAAAIQATMRMLWRLKGLNQSWRRYDLTLIDENRWRARRYGTEAGLIDFGRGSVQPMGQLVEEWLDLVAADTDALGTADMMRGLRAILSEGTSAERQRRVYQRALSEGADEAAAFRAVGRCLADEFLA